MPRLYQLRPITVVGQDCNLSVARLRALKRQWLKKKLRKIGSTETCKKEGGETNGVI